MLATKETTEMARRKAREYWISLTVPDTKESSEKMKLRDMVFINGLMGEYSKVNKIPTIIRVLEIE
jgi:hypothetical protein